ncbi:MAG: hypothetical protein M3Q19_02095 [Pseudomonadota bacterium]|nr:hypothetical protein [Pseudomonadota bacterium]
MNLRTMGLVAAGAAALLVSTSSVPAQPSSSPKATQKLANALAGRTPGTPVSCISDRARMQIVDDWTILYRDRGTVYVQRPRGGCHGLSNNMSLIRNQFVTTRLCRGDINRIVDLRTGFGTGACVFSEFVPYRKLG